MLASKSPAQPGDEIRHFEENLLDAVTPITSTHVQQWIDVNVRVAGVPEDDTCRIGPFESSSDSAHVRGQFARWHRRVLDELHGTKRRIHSSERRAGSVSK